MLIAHKVSISDDLAAMHKAEHEFNISQTHAFMAGNVEDLTAAAKRAAQKALARGELSGNAAISTGASSEGASILDSYMQGHDPEEFREMEKSEHKTLTLADNPP